MGKISNVDLLKILNEVIKTFFNSKKKLRYL
jgi:hypothetical protein